jgi:hypothetical protein
MQALPRGWVSLALGFAALFLGLNLGKDVAHKYLPKAVGGQ